LILKETAWESLRLFDVQIKTEDKLTAVQHRVLILGVGNILLKDEGIGVHVAQQLSKYNLPDNVEVIDGGTSGLDVLLSEEGSYKLVVIDAIRFSKKPGTVYKTKYLAPRPVRVFPVGQSQISLHQLGLIDALVAAEKMGCLPEEIVIVGVEPGEVDLGLELTEKVAQSISEVIEKVLEEI
jgi:hydrogenase maturation protease